MTKREISERNRQWLAAEMQAWQAEGVLSQEQPDRILALYETPQDAALRKHSVATFALMSVAALLVGLAALLLIGYNWEAMPKPAKLAVVFGVIAVTHGAGFWLRYERQCTAAFRGRLLSGLPLLRLRHLARRPDLQHFGPLSECALDVGLGNDSVCALPRHAPVARAGRGLIGDVGGDRNLWTSDLSWSFWRVPDACYTLPLLAVPGLMWAYRKGSPATLGLYVPLLAWWVILQPIAWHSDVNVVYFIGAAGALFLAIAECHETGSPMARALTASTACC